MVGVVDMSSSMVVVVVDTSWSSWLWLMVGLVNMGVVVVAVLVSHSSSLTVGVVNASLLSVFVHLLLLLSSSHRGICHGHGNGIVVHQQTGTVTGRAGRASQSCTELYGSPQQFHFTDVVVLAWTCWCRHLIIASVAVQVSLVASQALLVMVVASLL